jgi:very-short-patch-repair endonuclease
MIRGTGKAYHRARELRREMTLPEVLLWQQLRGSQTGLKWRKQHAAGPYALDFYCDRAKLCIEVDGEAHSRGDRPARAAARDAWLGARGIETLRIAAADILNNLKGVLLFIAERVGERAPLHPPAAPGGPPPRDELGEEF